MYFMGFDEIILLLKVELQAKQKLVKYKRQLVLFLEFWGALWGREEDSSRLSIRGATTLTLPRRRSTFHFFLWPPIIQIFRRRRRSGVSGWFGNFHCLVMTLLATMNICDAMYLDFCMAIGQNPGSIGLEQEWERMLYYWYIWSDETHESWICIWWGTNVSVKPVHIFSSMERMILYTFWLVL